MTNELSFFIYYIFPLLGFLIGSIKQFRFINNRQSLHVLIIITLLTSFSIITQISFSFDIIDEMIFALGLTTIGYCGTNLNGNNNGLKKTTVRLFKVITIIIYVSLPFVFAGMFYMAFGGDKLGSLVHINEDKTHRIKHQKINSNFTFPGYHNAYVFKKILLIEYPVNKFSLGKYGQYGFNGYLIIDSENKIPLNKFEYDEDSKSLILLHYDINEYKISKKFKNSP